MVVVAPGSKKTEENDNQTPSAPTPKTEGSAIGRFWKWLIDPNTSFFFGRHFDVHEPKKPEGAFMRGIHTIDDVICQVFKKCMDKIDDAFTKLFYEDPKDKQ